MKNKLKKFAKKQDSATTPEAPEFNKLLNSVRWSRALALALILYFACKALISTLLPLPEQVEITWEGPLRTFVDKSSRGHRYAIYIGDELATDRIDLTGRSFQSFPYSFKEGEVTRIRYFKMSTLFSTVGVSQPTNIVLRVEQDGHVLFRQSLAEVREAAKTSGSTMIWGLFVCVFFAALCVIPFFKKSVR